MLKRNVEIGQDFSLCHQFDHLIDMRIGIDIVQSDPHAEFAKLPREVEKFRPDRTLLKSAFRIFQVDAIGARILRDDEQFLDACRDELFSLAQDIACRAGHEIAAQFWNDAEGAAVVAAFRNFQISIVARRQLDALRRHEIKKRIVRRRRRFMHRLHDGGKILRPADPAKVWELFQNRTGLGAHAAGDDDLAVFGRGSTDRRERFRLGAVEKAAGVDDDCRRVLDASWKVRSPPPAIGQ